MRKSKRRRKSSVNESYLLVIAICALSFIVAVKEMFISISASLANLSSSAQLSLLIFATTAIALVFYFKTKQKNFKSKNQYFSNINYMKLSDHQFEEFCADVLNRLGYKVKATQKTNDGGKDIVGTDPTGNKIYGECKKWTATTVGRPLVQKLKGAMIDANIAQGIFITTSKFSKPALDYAKRNNIRCVDRTELEKMIKRI